MQRDRRRSPLARICLAVVAVLYAEWIVYMVRRPGLFPVKAADHVVGGVVDRESVVIDDR